MAKGDTVGVRLEPEALARVDVVAEELTRRAEGAEVTRTATARTALLLGLETLEKKLGIKPPKP